MRSRCFKTLGNSVFAWLLLWAILSFIACRAALLPKVMKQVPASNSKPATIFLLNRTVLLPGIPPSTKVVLPEIRLKVPAEIAPIEGGLLPRVLGPGYSQDLIDTRTPPPKEL